MGDSFNWLPGVLCLVYSTQNASHMIYRLYVVCWYPGVAASRRPRGGFRPASIPVLLGETEALTAQCLRPASIPVLLGGAGALTTLCLRPASIPGAASNSLPQLSHHLHSPLHSNITFSLHSSTISFPARHPQFTKLHTYLDRAT